MPVIAQITLPPVGQITVETELRKMCLRGSQSQINLALRKNLLKNASGVSQDDKHFVRNNASCQL
jgi:hypothetical protein